jgi:hypothetical protein
MIRYYYFNDQNQVGFDCNGKQAFFRVDTESPKYGHIRKTISATFLTKDPPETRFPCVYDKDTEEFCMPLLTPADFLQNYYIQTDLKKMDIIEEPSTTADILGFDYFLRHPGDYITCLVD